MRNEDIIEYARQRREDLGIGVNETIGDIVELIRKAGYAYMESSFGKNFSGFSQYLGGYNFLIGFNTDCSSWGINFRRFTLSHELGHVTIPEHVEILTQEKLHRSVAEYRSQEVIEREADYFAINFLAPEKQFQQKIKNKGFLRDTIFEISDHFKISLYAAILRYLELTDQPCALIASNRKGYIRYEKRSTKMQRFLNHTFLYNQPIPPNSLTREYLKGRKRLHVREYPLNEWYRELRYAEDDIEVGITESVIELGYNKMFLTLLNVEGY
jgi:Zn-dependent peptidase ImmA (M78 family)